MIISLDFFFRLITIVVFLIWQFYWIITEQTANREKPKTTTPGFPGMFKKLRRSSLTIVEVLLFMQLLGLQILPFSSQSFLTQLVGLIFVVTGIAIAIAARRVLGDNWVPASEYQVKERQELVTSGIYRYIRHPIYLGIFLSITGGELVVQSYLVVISLAILISGYWQSRLEEKLLLNHFGNSYRNYMKRSKMFIPFLW